MQAHSSAQYFQYDLIYIIILFLCYHFTCMYLFLNIYYTFFIICWSVYCIFFITLHQ